MSGMQGAPIEVYYFQTFFLKEKIKLIVVLYYLQVNGRAQP